MKKNLLALTTNLLPALPALACPVCEKQQPKGFTSITHGVGPEGVFDYMMLYGSIVVVLLAFGLFFYFLRRPSTRHDLLRQDHLSFF